MGLLIVNKDSKNFAFLHDDCNDYDGIKFMILTLKTSHPFSESLSKITSLEMNVI